MKNPLTPAEIEPATFRFVAQHLNHSATAVPPPHIYIYIYYGRLFVSLYIISVLHELLVVNATSSAEGS